MKTIEKSRGIVTESLREHVVCMVVGGLLRVLEWVRDEDVGAVRAQRVLFSP